MKKLNDEIVELINNGVAKFDPLDPKNVAYIEAIQEEDKTIILVQNEKIEPKQFLELLEIYKDLNPWIYKEISKKNPDLFK